MFCQTDPHQWLDTIWWHHFSNCCQVIKSDMSGKTGQKQINLINLKKKKHATSEQASGQQAEMFCDIHLKNWNICTLAELSLHLLSYFQFRKCVYMCAIT